MPTPHPGESKNKYLKRCIPMLIKDEGKPQKQSIAICMNMFDRYVSKNGSISTEATNYLVSNFNSDLIQEDLKTKIQKIQGTIQTGIGITTGDPLYTTLGISKLTSTSADQQENNHITLNLIQKLKKPSPAKLLKFDDKSINNKFTLRPQGIIITDTINNPIFPLDQPIIDTSKFNLPDIKKRFQSYYTTLPIDFLPWHYTIEIINGKYYCFNTRPINMQFPINNIEFLDLMKENEKLLKITPSTKAFMKNQYFDLSNAIHICIVGDTNSDVYTKELYELIGRVCIEPFIFYFHFPAEINLRVINFNLGNKFIFNLLEKYIKR